MVYNKMDLPDSSDYQDIVTEFLLEQVFAATCALPLACVRWCLAMLSAWHLLMLRCRLSMPAPLPALPAGRGMFQDCHGLSIWRIARLLHAAEARAAVAFA